MEQLLLRPHEAAAAIGVSRTKVYALIKAGEIPSVRLGLGSVRVPAEGLRAWVAGHLAAVERPA